MDTYDVIDPNNSNKEFAELANIINSYLNNSKESGVEYVTINNLIEDNCQMYDEEISSTLFTPMYIGLMGTFIGIIFGVISVSLTGDSNDWNNKINNLLWGVGLAMIVSFVGLALSVYNSNILYPKAKLAFDKGKIRFKNFIQAQLIPLNIKHDISSIASLNRTIGSFNKSFDEKLSKLGNYLETNIESFRLQEELLNKFENINIKNITNSNLALFEQFSKSAKQLEVLNLALQNVNNFVQESNSLSSEANRLFNRFKNFEENSDKIANEIGEKLTIANELLNFLKKHFEELEKISTYTIRAVGDIDEKMGTALEELENNVKIKQRSFANSLGETDTAIKKSYSELSYHLKNILSELIEQTDGQAKFIGNAHEEALKKFDKSLHELTQSIDEKIKNILEIINNDSLNAENILKENKTLFRNLEKLENIKQEITLINSKLTPLSNNSGTIPLLLEEIKTNIQKNGFSKIKIRKNGSKEIKQTKKEGFFRRIFRFRTN